jgi:hypothetical protein
MKEVWKLIVEQNFTKSKFGNEILVIEEMFCVLASILWPQSKTDSAGISTTYLQQ